MVTQSLVPKGMWLLGLVRVEGGRVSSLSTESDRPLSLKYSMVLEGNNPKKNASFSWDVLRDAVRPYFGCAMMSSKM